MRTAPLALLLFSLLAFTIALIAGSSEPPAHAQAMPINASAEISAALDAARELLEETVIYSRGELAASIPAVIGQTLFRLDDDRGATLTVRSVDFLAAGADLAFLPGLPIEGDVITRTVGSRSEQHEVTRFNGEPAWRWRDAGQTQLRIHTRLTQSVEV